MQKWVPQAAFVEEGAAFPEGCTLLSSADLFAHEKNELHTKHISNTAFRILSLLYYWKYKSNNIMLYLIFCEYFVKIFFKYMT